MSGSTDKATPPLLYVLRHAKSSWDDPGLSDHDRPLAPRGRKAAKVVGRHLEEAGIRPELVLCSSARRARETYELVQPVGELLIEPALYGASADEVIERVREVPDSTDAVMVIGHNPALQMAVLSLVSSRQGGDARAFQQLREKFPTCALATVRVTGSWPRLGPSGGELVGLVRPADLG